MRIRSLPVLMLALGGLALATPAAAQQIAAGWTELAEVDDLGDVLRHRPEPDVDTTETVAVFTNTGGPTAVYCIARNAAGDVIGRGATRVPAFGLSFLRASTLASGADFVGHMACHTGGHVVGSAFLLAPGGVTDMPVKQGSYDGRHRMRVPVVASF